MKKFITPIIQLIIIMVVSAGIIIGAATFRKKELKPQEIDKTYNFCMKIIEKENRGYGDEEIRRACFEKFSGMKIEEVE